MSHLSAHRFLHYVLSQMNFQHFINLFTVSVLPSFSIYSLRSRAWKGASFRFLCDTVAHLLGYFSNQSNSTILPEGLNLYSLLLFCLIFLERLVLPFRSSSRLLRLLHMTIFNLESKTLENQRHLRRVTFLYLHLCPTHFHAPHPCKEISGLWQHVFWDYLNTFSGFCQEDCVISFVFTSEFDYPDDYPFDICQVLLPGFCL